MSPSISAEIQELNTLRKTATDPAVIENWFLERMDRLNAWKEAAESGVADARYLATSCAADVLTLQQQIDGFELAAQGGSANGMRALASCFQERAIELLREASELGDAHSAFLLGWEINGRGDAQGSLEAFQLWKTAAEAGHVARNACRRLGASAGGRRRSVNQ